MKNLLRIDSSLFAEHGVSTQLASYIERVLIHEHPELEVVHRSFAEQAIPHVDGSHLQALMTAAQERSDEQAEQVAFSDTLIAELKEADALVLTAPMYNFQIPSMLKAWFDHIARAGETFKYTENGPVGLIANKPVYVISTRGGLHQGQEHDTMETFLKTVLAFVGLTQVEFIYAEGLNMGEQGKEQGIAAAEQVIDQLVATQAA